ncbi:MAG: hypothetical protein MMC33_004122 [Icmadophila ericetorum]|nr:hypothetical protein [Icmadophila ericetorum]
MPAEKLYKTRQDLAATDWKLASLRGEFEGIERRIEEEGSRKLLLERHLRRLQQEVWLEEEGEKKKQDLRGKGRRSGGDIERVAEEKMLLEQRLRFFSPSLRSVIKERAVE